MSYGAQCQERLDSQMLLRRDVAWSVQCYNCVKKNIMRSLLFLGQLTVHWRDWNETSYAKDSLSVFPL